MYPTYDQYLKTLPEEQKQSCECCGGDFPESQVFKMSRHGMTLCIDCLGSQKMEGWILSETDNSEDALNELKLIKETFYI